MNAASINQKLIEPINQLFEQVRHAKAMAKVMLHANIEEINPRTYFDYFEALHDILSNVDNLAEQMVSFAQTLKNEAVLFDSEN